MRLHRIAVGISGGVDSAVAALLLRKKGFDVQGVFMKNWDIVDETGICSTEKDRIDADIVCKKLNIPLIHVDFVKQYWNEVFCDLLKDYQSGFTPNPDVLCNKNVKFKWFFDYCRNSLGVDAIATGHYANTSFGPYLEDYKEEQNVKLYRPLDLSKDQTLFLSQVAQDPLRRTMFPLALMKKTLVRKIAHENNLTNVADKRDSVGICFVGKRDFQNFISEYVHPTPGKFIDIDTGKEIATHDGLHNWTLGQRCKLGGYSQAYFTARKNVRDNIIYVASGTEHPALRSQVLVTDKPHWIDREPEQLQRCGAFRCLFKFQHVQNFMECFILKSNDNLIVKLKEPMRALTPGQYAVFYDDFECFGSARILNAGPSLYFIDGD